MRTSSHIRVRIPFHDADDATRFAAQHGGVLDPTFTRKRWWVRIELSFDGPRTDLDAIRQRYRELAELRMDEHIRAHSWPTSEFDTPLCEQTEALFGAARWRRPLVIGFYPTGSGWAVAVVATPSECIELSASYLSDALGDLAGLANVVLRGDPIARCSFAQEPGETRWVARRLGERLTLTILQFDDSGDPPDEAGELRLSVECTAEELGAAVLACLEDVRSRYGEAGYLALWGDHPFPVSEHALLRARLLAG